jgi:hypothetical protein
VPEKYLGCHTPFSVVFSIVDWARISGCINLLEASTGPIDPSPKEQHSLSLTSGNIRYQYTAKNTRKIPKFAVTF